MSQIINDYPWEGIVIIVSIIAGIAIFFAIYLIIRVSAYIREIREEERAEASARWQLGWREREIRAIRSELEATRNDNRALAAELQKWRNLNNETGEN